MTKFSKVYDSYIKNLYILGQTFIQMCSLTKVLKRGLIKREKHYKLSNRNSVLPQTNMHMHNKQYCTYCVLHLDQ